MKHKHYSDHNGYCSVFLLIEKVKSIVYAINLSAEEIDYNFPE